MRVALIVPPIPDGNTTPALGPLYLAASARARGHEARVFDARFDADPVAEVRRFRPAVIGLSAVTPGYTWGLRAAAALRATLPEAHIVFGGPHPSALPSEVAARPEVDSVLVGECEDSLPSLCDALARSRLETVPGLVARGGVRGAPSRFLSGRELDELPRPAFELMNLSAYFKGTQTHGLFSRGTRILPIMTSRGCPSTCTYCCRVMGERLRYRSVALVLEEVTDLVSRYGIDELFIEDDNFTSYRSRALEILARLAALRPRLHVKFANGVRADRVDQELLVAMKAAGVYSLSFGIESGAPATLARMKKNLDLALARENVLRAKSLGFLVGSNLIIGYPGDTEADVEESLRFFLDLPLDSMAIVNLVPFPGTEVRGVCEANGYLTPAARDWDNYYFGLNRPVILIETPWLSATRTARLVRDAYRRIYLRPTWMFRTLRHLSLRQLIRGALFWLR